MDFNVEVDRANKSLTINSFEQSTNEDMRGYWVEGFQCLIKVHVEPGRCLLMPFQSRWAPKPFVLTSTRITHGTCLDNGDHFVRQDDWMCKSQSDVDADRLWTGRSVSVPKLRRVGDGQLPNNGRLTTDKWPHPCRIKFIGFVSRVQGRHAHQAVPKSKPDVCL